MPSFSLSMPTRMTLFSLGIKQEVFFVLSCSFCKEGVILTRIIASVSKRCALALRRMSSTERMVASTSEEWDCSSCVNASLIAF